MSETDATAMAGGNARAESGQTNDPASQDARNNENVVAFTRRDRAEPGAEEAAHVNQDLLQEATPPGAAAGSDVSPPSPALPPHVEIELKLLVDPDRLKDFEDAPAIAANARGKGSRKQLKSVYYDTPERTLWRNGLTLRVRKSGARFLQTVKAESGDDPLRRGEWEASVPSFAPDLALAMPFIAPKLRADLEAERLEAIFTSEIRRHTRMIDLPSGFGSPSTGLCNPRSAANPRAASTSRKTFPLPRENRASFGSIRRFLLMTPLQRSCAPAFGIFSSRSRPRWTAGIPRGFTRCVSHCAASVPRWI